MLYIAMINGHDQQSQSRASTTVTVTSPPQTVPQSQPSQSVQDYLRDQNGQSMSTLIMNYNPDNPSALPDDIRNLVAGSPTIRADYCNAQGCMIQAQGKDIWVSMSQGMVQGAEEMIVGE